jgi:hypothetical protein
MALIELTALPEWTTGLCLDSLELDFVDVHDIPTNIAFSKHPDEVALPHRLTNNGRHHKTVAKSLGGFSVTLCRANIPTHPTDARAKHI